MVIFYLCFVVNRSKKYISALFNFITFQTSCSVQEPLGHINRGLWLRLPCVDVYIYVLVIICILHDLYVRYLSDTLIYFKAIHFTFIIFIILLLWTQVCVSQWNFPISWDGMRMCVGCIRLCAWVGAYSRTITCACVYMCQTETEGKWERHVNMYWLWAVDKLAC